MLLILIVAVVDSEQVVDRPSRVDLAGVFRLVSDSLAEFLLLAGRLRKARPAECLPQDRCRGREGAECLMLVGCLLLARRAGRSCLGTLLAGGKRRDILDVVTLTGRGERSRFGMVRVLVAAQSLVSFARLELLCHELALLAAE